MAKANPTLPTVVQKGKSHHVDSDLVALCKMMRIMSERDIDATLPQVLKLMLLEGRLRPIGGSELSRISGLNRITVIHHLKRLEEVGLVRRVEGKYILRFRSTEDMLVEFKKEVEKMLMEMDELARQIDEEFGLFERGFANVNTKDKVKK
ncbi:MAG: helix-turn-helix domain-containing protein [Candidatus Anstonellaceae archaeon]